MVLLQPTYFAPLIQYASILKAKTYEFEMEDNFQKQTYRNRCYITGPNSKLLLNIPIQHSKNKKTKTKDVLIDNHTSSWQSIHLKSLQSSYRSSPFFEFYEDEITTILMKKHSYLLDLNLEIHDFIMEALQEKAIYSKSKEYFPIPENKTDLRFLANAKQKLNISFPQYFQLFSDKNNFLPNLSILDLLFMEGPSSGIYLSKIPDTLYL